MCHPKDTVVGDNIDNADEDEDDDDNDEKFFDVLKMIMENYVSLGRANFES